MECWPQSFCMDLAFLGPYGHDLGPVFPSTVSKRLFSQSVEHTSSAVHYTAETGDLNKVIIIITSKRFSVKGCSSPPNYVVPVLFIHENRLPDNKIWLSRAVLQDIASADCI